MSSSLRKKERRLARHLRNIKKEQDHKKEAWESGKLIKPNHNGGPYPEDYCIELGKRLFDRIEGFRQLLEKDPREFLPEDIDFDSLDLSQKYSVVNERFVRKFRLYKLKSIEFILHYNPSIPKTSEYLYIKKALEVYWDDRDNMFVLMRNE